MIEAKGLSKRYGSVEAVKGVSFSVTQGEIVGLLGPNGAGKTTILKMLTGYHYPSGGGATVDGLDLVEDGAAIAALIGYLPENAPLYADLTVMEYLDFVADARSLQGEERAAAVERVVGLCSLEKVIHRPIDTLSKGFRQRVGLAQAIIHDPKILILDEPTTGLDPNQIIEIRELIRSFGKDKTIILSTHILQEVEAVCSRVLILNEGTIAAQGTTAEIGKAVAAKGETRLSFGGKIADHGAAEASLRRLPRLLSVISYSARGRDGFDAVVSMEGDEDAALSVFDWAVANQARLSKLSTEKLSLEDLFVKLTRDGAPVAAGAAPGGAPGKSPRGAKGGPK